MFGIIEDCLKEFIGFKLFNLTIIYTDLLGAIIINKIQFKYMSAGKS